MSLRSGGARSRPQKHQNAFAFRHNKGSVKTSKILAIEHAGLCGRCEEKIEWRKRYRKYKPIKMPRCCNRCSKKKVVRAYHVVCDDCARPERLCPICLTSWDLQSGADGANSSKESEMPGPPATSRERAQFLDRLRLRERRTLERKLQQGRVVLCKNEQGSILQVEFSENQEYPEENQVEGMSEALEAEREGKEIYIEPISEEQLVVAVDVHKASPTSV